jgi:hypothetical protein
VTSSTGLPYTLHLDLPPVPIPPPDTLQEPSTPGADAHRPAEPLLGNGNEVTNGYRNLEEDNTLAVHNLKEDYVFTLAERFQGMYCPCTGFAYNSLAAERNYFVSFQF